MKKGYILYFLLTSLIPLQAQSPEGGGERPLVFEKIIICEGKGREILFQQLTEALSGMYDSSNVIVYGIEKISVKGVFSVWNRLVGKVGNPAGRIDFTLVIEVKDEKYRYYATDFYFTKTEKDRYGRFHTSDEQPVIVLEGNINDSLFKKIKIQGSEYLEKLEGLLTNQLVVVENKKVEW